MQQSCLRFAREDSFACYDNDGGADTEGVHSWRQRRLCLPFLAPICDQRLRCDTRVEKRLRASASVRHIIQVRKTDQTIRDRS